MFTWKLRRGLNQRVQQFAQSMAESRLVHGLFPDLEKTCRNITADNQELTALFERTTSFRRTLADSTDSFLGGRKPQTLTEQS